MRISDILQQDTPPRELSAGATSPSGTSTSRGVSPGDSVPSDDEDLLPTADTMTNIGNSRKRQREDYSAFAIHACRNVRIKPGSEDEKAVLHFSKLPSPAQRISLYASLKSLNQQVQTVAPADAIFEIPTKLMERIDKYAWTTLISPNCAVYVTSRGPLPQIMKHLEGHPEWGLTNAIQNEKSKYDEIVKRVQKVLTQRRNHIKSELKESVEKKWDIVRLTDEILHHGDKVLVARPVVSLQMLGRFAFLRRAYDQGVNYPTSLLAKDYWAGVDAELDEVRSTKKTAARMSSFFSVLLKQDMENYGQIDQPHFESPEFDPLADDE